MKEITYPVDRIRTLEDLHNAAIKKKSVVVPGASMGYRGPTPASWAINWPGEVLRRLMATGMFIYIPPSKTEKTND